MMSCHEYRLISAKLNSWAESTTGAGRTCPSASFRISLYSVGYGGERFRVPGHSGRRKVDVLARRAFGTETCSNGSALIGATAKRAVGCIPDKMAPQRRSVDSREGPEPLMREVVRQTREIR